VKECRAAVKIILFANTDWYLYNYRLPLAEALRDEGHEVLLLSPSGKYVQRILDHSFEWQVLNLSRRGINPIKELQTFYRLTQVYRREKPDIVHHFTIKCVLYGSFAARKAGVKRVINAITGLGYIFTSRNLFTWLAKPVVEFLYQRVLKGSRVIFQNQHDLNYFVKNKLVSENQCVLIPGSGVDVDKFKPAPHAEGTPLVVLPARMLWDKGVGEFVEAAELVNQSGVKARFALVGDVDEGNPSAIPCKQLQEWQEQGVIEWWGWQEDMASVYQQAAVVCLPSYYGEGLAKSLIEGAASGRALVASDIPGCREVIEDGVNGLLVPPQAAPILADALINMVYNRERLKRMGNASRKKAVRHFSQQKIIAATINLYKGLF
jgi:glycosyltransferase involved in cell wall biosynthesis